MGRKWSLEYTSAITTCEICGTLCVPKDIGAVCTDCILEIPKHIPEEQVEKYLKVQILKVGGDKCLNHQKAKLK